jgi:hypothetical protein
MTFTEHTPQSHMFMDFGMTLHSLLSRLKYKPGWEFAIQALGGMSGQVLKITISPQMNAWPPHQDQVGAHQFPIPPIPETDEKFWVGWLRDCIRKAEFHEIDEWFQIDDERPFYPHHFGSGDPYEER